MKADNILEVKNLSVVYNVLVKKDGSFFKKKQPLYALNNINFNLKKGEILGIVGESGCGKSTLGKAVLRLLDAEINGEIHYNNVNLASLNEKELKKYRKDIQIIFQDPLASLNPKMLIKDIIAEPLKVFHKNLSKKQIEDKVFAIMDKVGLSKSMANRYPHEFSGGQCQRIGIARAMILKPKLLVCDEAVSALDVSIKAQIINLLQDIKKEFGVSILFISHDLSVVKYISDRILVFYLGYLIEQGSSEQIYQNPNHPYTQSLISAIPTLEKQTDRVVLKGDIPSPLSVQKGCAFASRCQYVKEKCLLEKPSLSNVENTDKNTEVACFYPL
jgi:oligopeptide transport system ATP-binding protein